MSDTMICRTCGLSVEDRYLDKHTDWHVEIGDRLGLPQEQEPELSPLDALAEAMRLGHWNNQCEPYADVFPDVKERWQRSARAALRHLVTTVSNELGFEDRRRFFLLLDLVIPESEYADGADDD